MNGKMNEHNILIIDPIHESALRELKNDYYVEYLPTASREEVLNKVSSASILIVRSGHRVDEELINKASSLKLVARAGTGLDNVDTSLLDNKGISYFNLPSSNGDAVAELAIGFVFALSRNIPNTSARLKNNIWEKEKCYGTQIAGKVIGIIGYGNIGKKIAQRAKGLGMNVIASVSTVTRQKIHEACASGVELLDNNTILSKADYVCLSTPLNKETTNLITIEELKMMKPSAFLINVSRGTVVNENDLAAALANNIIKGAATDVFHKEKEFSPLFELDNVICTPHIGAMTIETQENIAKMLCDNIRNWAEKRS